MKTNMQNLSRRDVLKLAGATAAVAVTPGAMAAVSRSQGDHKARPATGRTARLFMTDAGKGKNILFLHGHAN